MGRHRGPYDPHDARLWEHVADDGDLHYCAVCLTAGKGRHRKREAT